MASSIFVVGDADDAGAAGEDRLQRLRRRHARRDPVATTVSELLVDTGPPGLEAQRVAVGALGNHADDLGLEPERVPHPISPQMPDPSPTGT